MKDEIKEILDNKLYFDLEEEDYIKIKDYITNLQEEIHKKEAMYDSLAVDYRLSQEENEKLKKENIKLYKKDTKIINELKEELQITQEKWDKDKQFSKCRTMEMLDYKSRNEKALNKIQYIIDYGFDYDGLNTVESLKGLIDMLVDYAIKSRNILNGGDE